MTSCFISIIQTLFYQIRITSEYWHPLCKWEFILFLLWCFCFLANLNNPELLMINMNILFFQNLFFNINLIIVAAERIYLHKSRLPLKVSFGSFTPNMIVLHISIILGAVIMLFVVRNFPGIFIPTNLWGSVIITLPFLLLKLFISHSLY